MTASDYLMTPCPHSGRGRFRVYCQLCFADTVAELLALRERQAAIDAETSGLEREIEIVNASLQFWIGATHGCRAEIDELRETLDTMRKSAQ